MTYREAIELLARRQETKWKWGLSRIEGLLRAAGNPERGLGAVHVAGTNGKGSFAALLSSILHFAGRRPGLYTSPHLVGPRERIRVDELEISQEDFGRHIGLLVESEPEEASYFELLTGAAFLEFREKGVGAAVLEVGMGGRLDATNVLERPLLTVITSIALDHVKHLGIDTAAIAREKAGILKPGVPCLCGVEDGPALAAIRERAAAVGAPLILDVPKLRTTEVYWDQGVRGVKVTGGDELALGFLGEGIIPNAALVLKAVEVLRKLGLDIPDRAVVDGFRKVRWQGRFQVLRPSQGRLAVLDGAHNPAAMGAFLETWDACPWSKDGALFVTGVLRDKDYRSLAKMIAPFARKVIASEPVSPRALPAAEWAEALREAGCPEVVAVPRVKDAWDLWLGSGAPAAAVFGSFYMVGNLLESLREVRA